MAYIGKQGISSTTLTSKTLSTMVGNGSTDTLTLSPAPDSVNDVAIYLDGIFQTPGTEYTLAGSTITFTTAPANNVFVCAIVGGGEHIGTPMDNSIGTDKLVDGTVTNAKIDSVSTSKVSGTLPALNANAVTNLNAANLVGSMPAIDGSNLTGISSFTKNANDPAGNTNPAGGVGTIWANTTSGELYVLTDATTDANVWTNVGEGTGNVVPFTGMVATGGSITTDGDYKVHSFTTSGSFSFNVTTAGTLPEVEYLVIAGGGSGGGGNDAGGGGGAGGYRTATGFSVSATSYNIVIGGGGAAYTGVGKVQGNDGTNSTFATITSTGGGGGGNNETTPCGGRDGGSGGGASFFHSNYSGCYDRAGQGIAGQGNDGGSSSSGDPYRGCGGGGAGAVGQDGNTGNGGAGLASDILVTGQNVLRAGGGGGASWHLTPTGSGGSGGGGRGGKYNGTTSTPGDTNTGSGGGGGNGVGSSNGTGAGGSGIVIIRYKFQ